MKEKETTIATSQLSSRFLMSAKCCCDESGRGRWYLSVMVLAILCIVFPETFVAPIGGFLKVDDQLEKADAVIMLLGGDSPERVLAAEAVYHRGFAPKIVFGSGFVDKEALARAPQGFHWEGSGQGVKRAFLSLGIPESDLIMVDSSNGFDTAGELTAVSEEIRRLKFQHVILLTSATHTRRARMIWNRLAPDIFAQTSSAPDPRLGRWWQYGRAVRVVGYEYAALVKELVRRVIS